MNWNSIRLALPLLLAVACAKEIPGQADLATEGGTLTVSLPSTGTKTALGLKTDGKYPVLWKEGDCLSLNGFSSLPLSAQDAGSSSAGFVFRDGLAAPYNLLYPVSGEADLVVFPATQMYVAGGFDPATVPMWGTSASYSNVTLRHFFSLVRISIKTETARVLKSITLTALGGEPISGSFRAGTDENGAFDGSLRVEDGHPSVIYSFGDEGLSLASGETAVAYISIPTGSYSAGFKAVVQSAEREYRQLRFFSDGREVAPGKVLEFPDKDFDDCNVIWEYFVSASGSGDGLSEDAPMSIANLTTLLSDPAGTKLKDATIHFVAGTHTISSPIVLPGKDTYDIPLSYTVTGDGQAVLDGGGVSRIFEIAGDSESVTIQDITLTNGSSSLSGGLVLIQAKSPVFEHVTFSNTASSEPGGAVRIDTANSGSGTFNNCTFSGNSSTAESGGAFVITNAGTAAIFTRCTFTGNTVTASGKAGGAIYATNGNTVFKNCTFIDNTAATSGGAVYTTSGTMTFENCTIGAEGHGNSAANGGAIYSTNGTIKINGSSVSYNSATGSAGGLYSLSTSNSHYSPTFYINNCSFVDNTAASNGCVIYLNNTAEGYVSKLCINNSYFYISKTLNSSNQSLVCNKGKTILLNSTIVGTVGSGAWGAFALGAHVNHADPNGCLLINSIIKNKATAYKYSTYETGGNYYAVIKDCLTRVNYKSMTDAQKAQIVESNISTDADINFTGYTWDGTVPSGFTRKTAQEIRKELLSENSSGTPVYTLAADFIAWLESLTYDVAGTKYNAFQVDINGTPRSGVYWPGAYQE